jgi:hypothetical protein
MTSIKILNNITNVISLTSNYSSEYLIKILYISMYLPEQKCFTPFNISNADYL